jgi:hypothetical protein
LLKNSWAALLLLERETTSGIKCNAHKASIEDLDMLIVKPGELLAMDRILWRNSVVFG